MPAVAHTGIKKALYKKYKASSVASKLEISNQLLADFMQFSSKLPPVTLLSSNKFHLSISGLQHDSKATKSKPI